ncbi:MAG: hypothetical protein WDO69_13775 [Pseudomonadota bacterium]
MRSLIPGKQTSLRSAQTLAGPPDLVDAWKSLVRTKLARQAELAGPEPKVRLQIDVRLVLFAAVFGLAGGPFGTVRSLVLLLSILLVQELSRAALARLLGRSARVSISLAGGRTEISGPELRGRAAFAFAMIGSLGNVALAAVLQIASREVHNSALGQALRELGSGHAVWGIAQALPLLPFRAGSELARRLSPPLRSGHAIASGGLAIGAVFAIFNLPKSPILLLALLFVAISSARAAYEAFQEELDRQSGVAGELEQARAALEAGDHRPSIAIVRATLDLARSKEQRQKLWLTLAWAGIGHRDPFAAHAGLQHLPEHCIDVHLLAAYLACCNRDFEAEELLNEARRLGQWTAATSKLLIELLFVRGDRAGALALTEADIAILSERDRRAALLALAAADGVTT